MHTWALMMCLLGPLFVNKVVAAESKCDARAVGTVGEIGLMQIRPATARAMARKLSLPENYDLMDPFVNLALGQAYLLEMIHRFGGIRAGLSAYNAGPGGYLAGIRVGYPERVMRQRGYCD